MAKLLMDYQSDQRKVVHTEIEMLIQKLAVSTDKHYGKTFTAKEIMSIIKKLGLKYK